MRYKLIQLIEQSEKDSFTKEEILTMINSFDNNFCDGYTAIDDECSVECANEKQVLPKKEFLIVKLLMNNKGKIVTRKNILKNVWDDGVIVGDRTIDVHISKIKRKFPGIPIITRKCFGYLWK